MNSFECDKLIVLGIIRFELLDCKQYIDVNEVTQVLSLIATKPDTFGYESFMCKLSNLVSKLAAPHYGRFMTRFKHRMRFYRLGRDWRTLHKNVPIGDMAIYKTPSICMYDVEIGLLLHSKYL